MIETLIGMLLGEDKSNLIIPILKNLKDNDFDIGKTIKNTDLSTVIPVILNFVYDAVNKPSPTVTTFNDNAVSDEFDIKNIAGEEIAERLNAYFNYN